MDAGYYPRHVGERGAQLRNERREQRKSKAVRTWLGREGSEKTILDVEIMEGQIADLRTQLERATISKNNTRRLVRPVRLAHLAHITSIENQDATTSSAHSGRTWRKTLSP